MFGSSILDVAIGMAVVYLILSLIASVIQEAIAAVLQSRSANLLQGIHSLFSGDKGPNGVSLLTSLYGHGLIRGLYRDPEKDSPQQNALRPFDKFRMKMQAMLGLAAPKAAKDAIANLMLLPAYIPSRTFALALIDILDPSQSGSETSLDQLRSALAAALKTDTGNKALQALSALADSAGNDLAEFQRRVENWYNDAMDRISGWYKKYTQNILMAIGLLIAVAFNVSSIHVAKTLWTDKDAREAMVAVAKQRLAEGPPAGAQGTTNTANPPAADTGKDTATPAGQSAQGTDANQNQSLAELQKKLSDRIDAVHEIEDKKLLPIGWNGSVWGDASGWPLRSWRVFIAIVGWVITALALSLGASFWFDTLNKFMIIRGTIKPDEKSQPEASKG